MKMIVRAASAAFLLFAAATTALAVSTTATPISSSTWTDLGAGPLVVQTLGDTAQIAVSDASPAANDRAFILYSAVGNVPTNFNSTSHIWAKALNNSTTVISAPITGSGGAGGSSTVAGTQEQDITESRTLNAASTSSQQTYTLNGQSTFSFNFAGLAASGATVSFYQSNDWNGTTGTFTGISEVNTGTGVPSLTRTTDGQSAIGIEGNKAIRVQVTTAGTGTITLATNISVRSRYQALRAPLPPGGNSIGSPGATAASGGVASRSRLPATAVGTNVTLAKTGAGRLYKIYACNTTTADRFIKFYDTSTAPTVGTTPVLISRVLPRSPTAGSPLCQSFDQENIGWSFASGLYYSILGTAGTGATYGADSDTTAVAAGDVVQVSVEYQ